jgi:hypothetical protein
LAHRNKALRRIGFVPPKREGSNEICYEFNPESARLPAPRAVGAAAILSKLAELAGVMTF